MVTRPDRQSCRRDSVYKAPQWVWHVTPGKPAGPSKYMVKGHRHNLRHGLLEKSKLAQHAYEKGHQIHWKQAKALETKTNNTYRKYKEITKVSLQVNPISQVGLDYLRFGFLPSARKWKSYNITQVKDCSYDDFRAFLRYNHTFLILFNLARILYGGAGVAQSVQCLTTDWTAGVRTPTEAEDFSSTLCVQTGSGAHPASYTMGTGGSFPGGKKRPGRDADHSPPSSAEVKKE
jgi:hypothetical protein